jgi:agmatine deiminase
MNFGYRMPAEWEKHAATWLTWPHNVETWPDILTSVEKEMVSIVAALSKSEIVRVNVLNQAHEEHVFDLLHNRVVPGTINCQLMILGAVIMAQFFLREMIMKSRLRH